MSRILLTGLCIASLAVAQDAPRRTEFPNCVDGPLASNTVCDQNATPGERANALVEAMNTEEKLANLVRCDISSFLFKNLERFPDGRELANPRGLHA